MHVSGSTLGLGLGVGDSDGVGLVLGDGVGDTLGEGTGVSPPVTVRVTVLLRARSLGNSTVTFSPIVIM